MCKPTGPGMGKKILASALSAAMVASFAPAAALADELEPADNDNIAEAGVDGDVDGEPADAQNEELTKAAMIGENAYETLQAAIEAAEAGQTVTLAADVTEDVRIAAGKSVTIDLNGNKITNASGNSVTVEKGATLTITGDGTVDNITHGKAAIYNMGTCHIDGGTIERSTEAGVDSTHNGGNSYYTVLNHGEMTVADGVTINNRGHYSSLFENGYYSYSDSNDGSDAPSLTINGGTFDGGLNTIKNDDGAQLTINGGTFKNYTQAAFQNHHIATINGGSFEATDCSAVLQCGVCNSVYDHDAHELTITAGTFKGALVKTAGRSPSPAASSRAILRDTSLPVTT